jgi:uncharacterized protein (DUF2249 family)
MSGRVEPRPVAPTDRVSDVLARDETLVEVFVRRSAHFIKLRNRAMRRIMARLVTVEEAARMAGVDAASLVAELNAALGVAPAPAVAASDLGVDAAETTLALEHPEGAEVLEVDVREDLRTGREPFSKIMAAVRAVGAGQVLRLRATFEPVPLYAVLRKRGFVHEARAEGPDNWSVWFWMPELSGDSRVILPAGGTSGSQRSAPISGAARPAPQAVATDPGAATVRLDVRGLEPPEPMVRTLAALEALPPGHTLVQLNLRVPQFLLPVLAERGYTWEVDESASDHVEVRIRRPA